MSYQYLFKSLRKQQLRGILLNTYVSNLINFTKLCSLLATFVNTQETFNVVSTLLFGWYDVVTSDNVKSTLKQRCVCQRSNLQRWTTSNQHCLFQRCCYNVRQRRNNAVIFNVEFHNVDQRRNDVVNMTIFKRLKRAKKYFLASKQNMTHLINNTCFWLWSSKKKGKHGTYHVKINVGKYDACYMKRIWK